MYKRLKRLYDEGRLTSEGLLFYAEHGMISREDYEEIIGQKEEEV